ncbi:hypothetical protein CNEO4_90011 [Clostridium neonatale]|nr:hypothetical protein CNEO4_90011 [Clostridium neonatale]
MIYNYFLYNYKLYGKLKYINNIFFNKIEQSELLFHPTMIRSF